MMCARNRIVLCQANKLGLSLPQNQVLPMHELVPGGHFTDYEHRRLQQSDQGREVLLSQVGVKFRRDIVHTADERTSKPACRGRKPGSSDNSCEAPVRFFELPEQASGHSGIYGTRLPMLAAEHRMWDSEIHPRRPESRSHILQIKQQVIQLIR